VDVGFSCAGGEEREEIFQRSSSWFHVQGLNPSLLLFRLIVKSPNCTRGRHIWMLMMQRNRNYGHHGHPLFGWMAVRLSEVFPFSPDC